MENVGAVGQGERVREWPEEKRMGRCSKRIAKRLQALSHTPWTGKQAQRLIKHFRRHQDELFTFLDEPDVPFHNNQAERSIRHAVVPHKNSYGNRSSQGADTQSIPMTIFFAR